MSETTTTFDVAGFFSSHTELSLQEALSAQKRLFESPEATKDFRAQTKALIEADGGDTATALKLGVALYVLGQLPEAIEALEPCNRMKVGQAILGLAYLETHSFAAAKEMLSKVTDEKSGPVELLQGLVKSQLMLGDPEGASKPAKAIHKLHPDSAADNYATGLIEEMTGNIEQALDHYMAAEEIDPQHQQAIFRLAFNLDLRGEDELAIETYLRCIGQSPVHINALVNLGVLYEDSEHYADALKCFQQVLQSNPNHPRALMFVRDSKSSMTMYYDEDKERRDDKRLKVLEVPVTDFELSVRSRNCLDRMNIHTLGDLTRISEHDLLHFKNFGETSLQEIKDMLGSRGLRLGQALEEKEKPAGRAVMSLESESQDNSILGKPVLELKLSIRARRAVDSMNCDTIAELVDHSEEEMLGMKNFGQTSLNEIKQRLSEFGVILRSS